MKTFIILCNIFVVGGGLFGIVQGFTPQKPHTGAFRQQRKFVRPLLNLAVGPEIHDLVQQMDFHNVVPLDVAHSFASSSNVLSDAAADAAAVAVKKGPGWWQSYLSVFKSCLITVHSTIDGPLRKMGFTQTWGPSIAVFTASVRACLVPLSIQQTKSSEYMKALKPYQNEIKARFADRQETMNKALAKLYEDAGTNPLAGCLVSLAQLPIFLGLYRAVRLLAMDGQLEEPFLWIPTLEGPVSPPTFRGMEWLTQGWTFPEGGIPVPSLGWETTLAFLAMPVILVLTQSFTMSVLQPPVDDDMTDEEKDQLEKSQRIIKFLPFMIGFFSLQVPAGLTIYWFTSNLFTLGQSVAVKSYYKANPPEINLPDYWDSLDDVENMTPEEKRAAAEAGINMGPKYEDLVEEAKFHYVVERMPLRSQSQAWTKIDGEEAKVVPTAMAAWVGSANGSANGAEPAPAASSESTTEAGAAKV